VRTPIVVDTNVLLVADGRSDYSRQCASSCARRLQEIQSRHVVVLDSGREILREYGQKLPRTQQPGVGYNFWKWLINTKGGDGHCVWVELSKHATRGYVEFPDHPDLLDFDPSDRKFVAVAAAHPERPEIVQAGDSRWWGWRVALESCGIKVAFPCEAELRRKWEDKFGPDV